MVSPPLLIFILGTSVNIALSWRLSIPTQRYHGIYRFFSFECILLLAIHNFPAWFVDPLAWNQILSWLLLTVSLVLAIQGFLLLRIAGKPSGDFENTSLLVKKGAYRYIRHPLYASLLYLGFGIFLKNVTLETTGLAFFNFIALVATAGREEKEMIARFGSEYVAYSQQTRRFVPFVF